MTSRHKIRAFSIIALTVLAVSSFGLPAAKDFGGNSDVNPDFARCEACHPDSADTTKTSLHYMMKCTDCHSVSGFSKDRHNAATTGCSGCHANVGAGKQHVKLRYFPEPVFVYNPGIAEDNRAVYVSLVKPVNGAP